MLHLPVLPWKQGTYHPCSPSPCSEHCFVHMAQLPLPLWSLRKAICHSVASSSKFSTNFPVLCPFSSVTDFPFWRMIVVSSNPYHHLCNCPWFMLKMLLICWPHMFFSFLLNSRDLQTYTNFPSSPTECLVSSEKNFWLINRDVNLKFLCLFLWML